MQLQMSCNKVEYPYLAGMDARSPRIPADSPPEVVPSPALGGAGWRAARGEPSLAGMFASVQTAKQGSLWRKLLAFLGPGYLVAVGYMDPGNWATSLAGGSKFGYALLTVALLSNVMAIVLQAFVFRWIEAFVVAMLGVIAACFAIQIAMANPDWGAVLRGFAPTTDILANHEILYLHSGLVQTRGYGDGIEEKREAITLATIDSSIALCLALIINASILILAAATFHRAGKTDVAELDQAHAFLAPLLGSTMAPTLFAIALLCCGLNSTITATLSGQIVMEG